ncbi:NPC intracellular cholesterol transporter 2 [Protopterus annectens]|uniref:NPC intracellular cholesterol transporter 2 n=1 Tax=Protopterus annectens TaxID=7888 RepID=UPI001CFAFD71|nr:NPC intracellular cholesterol transporter 2 [Protopterus annectens]XP_043930562.1 NPC intracellular cholesterol transporter 2 [Protopterus annectens]
MTFTTAFLLLLAVVSVVQAGPYKDCGSKTGVISDVEISSCTSFPCVLRKGETYAINVTFSSKVESQKCNAIVHGIIGGLPIPFPIPEPDGCKSGISCPVKSGNNYNYLTKMVVKSEYPSLKLVVKWELKSDDSEDLFCWEVGAEIVG